MGGWNSRGNQIKILCKLNLGEIETKIPRIGLNLNVVKYDKIELISFYIGGSDRIYDNDWTNLCAGTHALIFVVDSTNRQEGRFSFENQDRLIFQAVIKQKELRNLPILILANSLDDPNSMTFAEVTQNLELASCKKFNWYLQIFSTEKGTGLLEGLHWLSSQLLKN